MIGDFMGLPKEEKLEIIKKFQSSNSDVLDTGRLEVQIALLTRWIGHLTEHFKVHKKDRHSRRGLINLVNKRRHSLDYLKQKSFKRYKSLITALNIRK